MSNALVGRSGEAKMLHVMCVDDVDLVLKGIERVLEGWPGGQVVGSFQSVRDLLDGLVRVPVDILILDDHVDPDIGPFRLIEQVKALRPKVRIVLLGSVVDGRVVQEFFTQGIHGYLYKSDALADVLIGALETVARGKPYLSPTAGAEHLLAMQDRHSRWQVDEQALEILRLLAEGKHVSEIAQRLGKNINRVYAIRRRLRLRFAAENNEALIARATAEGFLP